MKKVITIVFLLFSSFAMFAGVGTFLEGVTINGTTYGANAALGTFAPNGLTMSAGYSDSYQNGGDDVCSVGFEYSVAGGVNSGAILTYAGVGSGGGDKKWANTGIGANFSNLPDGSYTLVINFRIYGKWGGVVCGGSGNDFVTGVLKTLSFTFTISTPMPVTLNEFLLNKKAKGLQLEWTTETESNSSHFEVEKSMNGINWTKLDNVKAAGNSLRRQNYSLTDEKPSKGSNYYRLKMVDRDGSFEYSKVVSTNLNGGGKVNIYPNPVQEVLTINVSDDVKEATVEMFNVNGQSQLRNVLNGNQLNISDLSAGLYFIQVSDENGQVITREKLMKK